MCLFNKNFLNKRRVKMKKNNQLHDAHVIAWEKNKELHDAHVTAWKKNAEEKKIHDQHHEDQLLEEAFH